MSAQTNKKILGSQNEMVALPFIIYLCTPSKLSLRALFRPKLDENKNSSLCVNFENSDEDSFMAYQVVQV